MKKMKISRWKRWRFHHWVLVSYAFQMKSKSWKTNYKEWNQIMKLWKLKGELLRRDWTIHLLDLKVVSIIIDSVRLQLIKLQVCVVCVLWRVPSSKEGALMNMCHSWDWAVCAHWWLPIFLVVVKVKIALWCHGST